MYVRIDYRKHAIFLQTLHRSLPGVPVGEPTLPAPPDAPDQPQNTELNKLGFTGGQPGRDPGPHPPTCSRSLAGTSPATTGRHRTMDPSWGRLVMGPRERQRLGGGQEPQNRQRLCVLSGTGWANLSFPLPLLFVLQRLSLRVTSESLAPSFICLLLVLLLPAMLVARAARFAALDAACVAASMERQGHRSPLLVQRGRGIDPNGHVPFGCVTATGACDTKRARLK